MISFQKIIFYQASLLKSIQVLYPIYCSPPLISLEINPLHLSNKSAVKIKNLFPLHLLLKYSQNLIFKKGILDLLIMKVKK